MWHNSELAKTYKQKTVNFFDSVTPERGKWKAKNRYYYEKVRDYLKFIIPEGYSVLQIGSGDGELLSQMKPSKGVGIDASPAFVRQSQQSYPDLKFYEGFAEDFIIEEKFDYILMSNVVGYLFDVEEAFKNITQACRPNTRVVIQYYNCLWGGILHLGDLLGLRMKQGVQNWLSQDDLQNLLHISGFETIRKFKKVLFPYRIPVISWLINTVIANLPLINRLCLTEFIVARPKTKRQDQKPSISIMIPTKDEVGNIHELIERVPAFPGEMEIVVVDGHSTDGTQEAVEKAIREFPEKNIRLLDQGDTKGKGAAVRIGFEASKGDILLILDSDISVAPEDTLKFYQQLVEGNGEMINGSRLVYPMEKQAMRFLNMWANKFFSVAFTYLLGQRLKDTLCGTKALYRDDYEKIAHNRSFFGEFDPFGDFDLLFGAAKLNLSILEVPVRYHERRYGEIKIHRFRHGLLLLGMCMIALRKLKFI